MSTVLSLVGVVIALVIASVVIAVVFDRVISYGPFLTREERRARRERAEEHQARRRERDAWPHRQHVEVLLENPPGRWRSGARSCRSWSITSSPG